MPLEITLLIVIAGISATVALVHLMGWSGTRQFGAPEDIRAIWADFYPDETIGDFLVSDDRCAVLLTLAGGGIGLIWAFGDEAVVRRLHDPRPVEETETGLCIRLGDFTAPKLHIRLVDPADRNRWAAILAGRKEAA